MSFQSLGLSQPVLQALALKDYKDATPIQIQAIPTLLKGRDLLGIAQTGTGKTAAFMLPSIDRLAASAKRPQRGACRMLVLAPTRELASQIAESARQYSRFSHMSVATVFGGTSVNKNRQDLSRGVDILVATPGRLIDLVEQRYLDLRDVEILVLDEADQMLDLGFIHDLKRIVRMLPAKRQSLFFSATMPRAIQELADKFLTDPAQVAVTPVSSTVERVEQYVTYVQQAEKPALLTMLLRREKMERVLIFSRTKHGADRIVKQLAQSGIPANAIHGNKSQPQRERALGEFKAGKVKILIATDIAARGIDVSGVSHVINFDLPNVSEQYVHRIGRTARAGAAGIAIAFCADDERAYLKGIERLTRQRVDVVPLPENFLAESNRIKAERAASPIPDRPERDSRGERREDRNRVRRPKSRRPNFGSAGAPKTNRARRRASGR
jgi:ATP-dependent RNA helicase RhlE